MTPEQSLRLRAPFPPESIGQLPASKGRPALDYVGHAATTDRLLQVDPDWTWEPPTTDELQRLPSGDGMWIKLTVCGVTRYGWGEGKNIKEWIGYAIRNAAMRFGVALDLWTKEELAHDEDAEAKLQGKNDGTSAAHSTVVASAPSKSKIAKLRSRASALVADKVSVADARMELGLPSIDKSSPEELERWDGLLTDLEASLTAPFVTETAPV